MGDRGRYLYAVCRGLDPSALTGVPAVGQEPLEIVEVLDLQGVVSTVDLDEFGEDGLRSNLEKLDWVEQTARRHDAVVQACGQHAPTAPMRMTTIYLDDGSVRRQLELWYDALVEALNRVAGRQEWSVKVYANASARQRAPEAEPAVTSGAAYLRQKKTAAEERRTAEARAMTAAEEVDRALGGLAVATRHLRAQDPRLSGVEETMLLNGAYLVDEHAAPEFTAQVAALVAGHPEVSIACGGPWPPYSFATVEEQ
ncbi:GvpL/GvpF family gas vesicle protein [Nocardioides sp. HM23]|uniref:GvpL/GvpF family gas vesicle protein n=1 Tax=Nocardioides bizhenqiangii TaxID=3095076 RepID=UPI002ACAD962|nr:GvpL/GvpF family gas vesicle protein [Nocardioides sp. HM23]MDZ5621961.1 GvpL/GvpF family gas vesicle protein [Nocardioides sp. HM23]